MNIALGAAKALERLHLQVNPSIIHRDIKSDNILLCLDFEPKVSDFGSAKIAPAGGAGSGQVGTFGYMAPEVAFCKSLSIRSDIYSFGVVLLELITGRKAMDSKRQDEEQHLVTWVHFLFIAIYLTLFYFLFFPLQLSSPVPNWLTIFHGIRRQVLDLIMLFKNKFWSSGSFDCV